MSAGTAQTRELVSVRFDLYTSTTLPLPAVAERLGTLVRLPLVARTGTVRGPYYRWNGDDGADLLVQANVLDDDGLPCEPLAPPHVPLVYATGLPDAVHAALAGFSGLTLVAADRLEVPCHSPAPAATCPR